MIRTGNQNGENGQTGSLREVEVTADLTVQEWHGGRVLEVDPQGETITITLPDDACGPGFFAEILQISAGTVEVVAAAGVSIDSTAGTTPSLTAQWSEARLRRRGGTSWHVGGAIS